MYSCELRKPKGTDRFIIRVPLSDLKFLIWMCSHEAGT